MKLLSRISILTFFLVSIIGLFLPWFFFSKTVDYRVGLQCMNIGMIIGYLGSLVSSYMILMKNESVDVYISNLLFMILIIISCIYGFFTWYVETITGSISLRISIETSHYGFYITLVSTTFAVIVYLYNLIRKRI